MHGARCGRWAWWILLVTAHAAAAQEPAERARAILGSTELRFDDSLHQLTYSPDGRFLAVASSEGNWLVELETRRSRSLRPVAWHAARTRGSGRLQFDFTFSPDMRTLVVIEWRGTVALYDVSSGELLGHIKRAGDGVSRPEFSADGAKATVRSREGVTVFNPRSGEILSHAKSPDEAREARGVVLAKLSQKTDLLEDGASQTLHEVDRESGKVLRSIELAALSPATVLGVVAPPGLGRVAVIFDKGVGILDLAAGPGDRFMWTTGLDAGDEPLEVGGDFVHAGTRLIVTHTDSEASLTRFVSIDLGRPAMQRLELTARVDAFPLALSPDASQLAVGDGTKVVLFDLKRQQRLTAPSGHLEAVRHVAISPDGKHVASSAQDGVRVWSVEDGRELAHFEVTASIASYGVPVAFSPDSRSVFLGTSGYHLFDIASGALTALEMFDAGYVVSPCVVRYLPGGREVLVAGSERYARIDPTERRLIEDVPYKQGAPAGSLGKSALHASIVVSSDGQFLAHSGPVESDPGCTVQRLVGGVVLRRLIEGGRQYLGFAADGRLFAAGPEGTSSFAAGSFDPQAVWRTAPDRPRIVSGLEVSPDGKLLAGRHSPDERSRLRVVRTEEGDDVFLIPRPVWEGDVETVWGFSPDGASLVVGYRSGLVAVWRVSPP